MSAKKKYKLIEDDHNELIVYGLVSEEKEYRLCWLLNHALGINLSRTDNIKYTNRKLATAQEFECYSDSISQETVLLIRNNSAEGIKIAEAKQFDFLFLLSPHYKDQFSRVRDIAEIRGVFELNNSIIEQITLP